MKTIYWKAESYKGGELDSIDFPQRETQADAIRDAETFLSGLSEFDARHITAGIVEWETDGENATNTGQFADVTL